MLVTAPFFAVLVLFGGERVREQDLEGKISDFAKQTSHQPFHDACCRQFFVPRLIHIERPVYFDLQSVAGEFGTTVALRCEPPRVGLVAQHPQAVAGQPMFGAFDQFDGA